MEKLHALVEGYVTRLKKGASTRTILVAENENISRAFLVGILAKEGYRVVECVDGEVIPSVVKDEGVDFLVMNPDLFGTLEGLVFPEALRREELEKVPILLVSGGQIENSGTAAFPGNVVGILEKPVDRFTLLSYIEEGLVAMDF